MRLLWMVKEAVIAWLCHFVFLSVWLLAIYLLCATFCMVSVCAIQRMPMITVYSFFSCCSFHSMDSMCHCQLRRALRGDLQTNRIVHSCDTHFECNIVVVVCAVSFVSECKSILSSFVCWLVGPVSVSFRFGHLAAFMGHTITLFDLFPDVFFLCVCCKYVPFIEFHLRSPNYSSEPALLILGTHQLVDKPIHSQQELQQHLRSHNERWP